MKESKTKIKNELLPGTLEKDLGGVGCHAVGHTPKIREKLPQQSVGAADALGDAGRRFRSVKA